jgi:CHASE3 domain sensor protein
MKKQLEQMGKELRELMIYQSPPELGALYTEVDEMMKEMGTEQRVLISRKMANEDRERERRKKRIQRLYVEITIGVSGVLMAAVIGLAMVWVVHDRIEKYPHLGTGWIPKTEEQRRLDALPKQWNGR